MTSPNPNIQSPGAGQVGALYQKRVSTNNPLQCQQDLDWAVCTLDKSQLYTVRLSDTISKYPKKLVQEILSDSSVLVQTGTTGIVKGVILRDYSLVALPGSKKFQRMWVLILERTIGEHNMSPFYDISILKIVCSSWRLRFMGAGCHRRRSIWSYYRRKDRH
jgi:hypothetical protein